MLSRILFKLSFLIVSVFSLNQAYSVFAFPLSLFCIGVNQVPYADSAGCPARVDNMLQAAADAGFNTIDITYMGTQGPYTDSGALSGMRWRNAYRDFFRQVLSFDNGRFNISVRINTNATSLSSADRNRRIHFDDTLPDYNADYFLKHAPIDSPLVAFNWATDASGMKHWDPWADFYDGYNGAAPVRHRTPDPWNPFVRGVVRDLWRAAVEDVVAAADSVGGNAPQRVLWFTLNWSSTGESEYQHDFFVGNGYFYQIYNSPNDDPSRINWIQERQDSLATLHGELSDLTKQVKDSVNGGPGLNSPFDFTFGAQWSGIQVGTSLLRGHIDLARLASRLNPGDWIHVADIADVGWEEFNHNFSMDYARSIAGNYGLRVSNECSWPTFLLEMNKVSTMAAANNAYRQQALRSLNHGAQAFFVTNWSKDTSLYHLTGDHFYGNASPNSFFIPFVTENYASVSTNQAKGEVAIFLDPWAIYATEGRASVMNQYGDPVYLTQDLYSSGVSKELYDTLSANGANRVDILTPRMLEDSPGILNDYRRVYIPAINTILTASAKDSLVRGRNKHKLTLMGTAIGKQDWDQTSAGGDSVSAFIAEDLLWADYSNLYPNLSGYEDPALQVTLSKGTHFPEASNPPWFGGLGYGWGYVGDFNGDGLDDFMNRIAYSNIDVYLASGSHYFHEPSTWAGSGYYEEYHVGDFNGDEMDDLLMLDLSSGNPEDLYLLPSTGEYFDEPVFLRTFSGVSGSRGRYVGDFNGDDTTDFLTFTNDYKLRVSLSAKSAPTLWGDWGADAEDIRVGDFNGDGRDDLLWIDKTNKYNNDLPGGFEYPGIQVALSTGTSFATAKMWKKLSAFSGSQAYYVGDFNGDGRDDIMSLASNYDFQIALASNRMNPSSATWTHDTTNFGSVRFWGSWGVIPGNMFVGNFGRPGAALYKKARTAMQASPSEKRVLNRGNLLFFRGVSGPVTLYDFSGKKVMRGSVRDGGTLNISSLSTGTYFVELPGYRTKLVKMRQ